MEAFVIIFKGAHIINVFSILFSVPVSGGAGERQARAQQKLFTMDVDEEENMSKCLYDPATRTFTQTHGRVHVTALTV